MPEPMFYRCPGCGAQAFRHDIDRRVELVPAAGAMERVPTATIRQRAFCDNDGYELVLVRRLPNGTYVGIDPEED